MQMVICRKMFTWLKRVVYNVVTRFKLNCSVVLLNSWAGIETLFGYVVLVNKSHRLSLASELLATKKYAAAEISK